MAGRQMQRRDMDSATRLVLLESDADECEERADRLGAAVETLTTQVNTGLAKVSADQAVKFGRLYVLIITLCVTVLVGCIGIIGTIVSAR